MITTGGKGRSIAAGGGLLPFRRDTPSVVGTVSSNAGNEKFGTNAGV